jgi:hypothetical protein
MLPVTFPAPQEDLVSGRFGDKVVPVADETNEIFVRNPTGGRCSELVADHGFDLSLLAQR